MVTGLLSQAPSSSFMRGIAGILTMVVPCMVVPIVMNLSLPPFAVILNFALPAETNIHLIQLEILINTI